MVKGLKIHHTIVVLPLNEFIMLQKGEQTITCKPCQKRFCCKQTHLRTATNSKQLKGLISGAAKDDSA